MIFVKADELKKGMRLAKPIYNKNGVMLYERDSRLTEQGIISIQNFGLIGIYVLEPAEPVPPMSAEDIEFERYQTMAVFAIKEILDAVSKQKPSAKLNTFDAACSEVWFFGPQDKFHPKSSQRGRLCV